MVRAFLAVGLLAGCTYPEGAYQRYYGEPEVIGGAADFVQVRSGYGVDPSPAARDYCGGLPVMVNRTQEDRDGFFSITEYRCS